MHEPRRQVLANGWRVLSRAMCWQGFAHARAGGGRVGCDRYMQSSARIAVRERRWCFHFAGASRGGCSRAPSTATNIAATEASAEPAASEHTAHRGHSGAYKVSCGQTIYSQIVHSQIVRACEAAHPGRRGTYHDSARTSVCAFDVRSGSARSSMNGVIDCSHSHQPLRAAMTPRLYVDIMALSVCTLKQKIHDLQWRMRIPDIAHNSRFADRA